MLQIVPCVKILHYSAFNNCLSTSPVSPRIKKTHGSPVRLTTGFRVKMLLTTKCDYLHINVNV